MAKQIRKSSRNQSSKRIISRNNKLRTTTKTQNVRGRGRVKANGVIKKQISKAKVQDARQKILQKKRKTVVDARDVLAKIAKGQDARSKIDKIRYTKTGVQTNGSNVKVIGSSILRKTDRNGKISLVTNKSKNASDMNMAIKKQLGLISSSPRTALKKSPPKRPVAATQVLKAPVPIRKTILNDFEYGPLVDPLSRIYDSNLYKWIKPDLRTASQMINSLETTRQAMRDVMREELLASNRWSDYAHPKPVVRLQPTSYVDLDALEDEEMPLVTSAPSRIALQGSTRMSNVHSRLDRLPSKPESHGILSQTKTKVVVPAGHRIVVSNLQSTVTQDDIKELFEDIGQLLTARLVRPGVAEVIYKNLKDAQKAVDTYHNRQLDGQPMKCLLVNKRPGNQPTALPLHKESVLSARKSTVSISSSAAKLVPDINTIHKVLFQRK